MTWLPSGTANAGPIEEWLPSITERLQELLGNEGTRAVLRKALNDARKSCPELNSATVENNGINLLALRLDPCNESAVTDLDHEHLTVLVESLHQLLINLLGGELTSQVFTSLSDNYHE
ncbi:MAG: hypothetical protein ACOX87_13525 [Chloroflexota bacterium]|jgi:hypothetical protein